MTPASTSVALTESVDEQLREHLVRDDRQEDLCFALYQPCHGAERFTAIVAKPCLPRAGERQVHGNASFNAEYFDRVLDSAVTAGMGVAFFHTHPGAKTWQAMSGPDERAEQGMAAAVGAATGLPLVGLTLSGSSGFWSARTWHRVRPRCWEPKDCEAVRVVGRRLTVSFCPRVNPPPQLPPSMIRTVHAWGDRAQIQLSRLRIGIVGLGSVGMLLNEELARMGFGEIVPIDFDIVKEHNLDRMLHAYPSDAAAARLKVELAAAASMRSAVLPGFRTSPVALGIQDIRAYRRALDCDVLFSCVDRPWPRAIMNHLSYANLIPLIDGGVDVSRVRSGGLRSADWATFVVGPGRRCLECAGQYDAGMVAVEQDGDLDDPEYIESLPDDHPLKKRQNVFCFSTALASMEAMKLVQLAVAPGGISAPDEERYTIPAGHVETVEAASCKPSCAIAQLVALGEHGGHPGTESWPGLGDEEVVVIVPNPNAQVAEFDPEATETRSETEQPRKDGHWGLVLLSVLAVVVAAAVWAYLG